MIVINLFKAGYGDTMLVSVKMEDESHPDINILIDCGFGFQTEVLPMLRKMHEDGKKVDRFIITHFDNDHIIGAANFISENGNADEPNIIRIEQVWLNTFRHLQFSIRENAALSEIQRQPLLNMVAKLPVAKQKGEGEIGAKQASTLGALLYRFNYPWNSDFAEKAVSIDTVNNVIINDNVTVRLLSPSNKNLALLENDFIKELTRQRIPVWDDRLVDDAFELYIKSLDIVKSSRERKISGSIKEFTVDSINRMKTETSFGNDNGQGNGSSIAFILESGGKKVLFLADAHSADIAASLKAVFPDEKNYPVVFDAIKVSHHGSLNNSDPVLFGMIDSSKYLFSTNGKHPSHVHPDPETIALIIDRPLSAGITKRELVFNYHCKHLDGFNNESLKARFKFSIEIKQQIIL